MRDDLRGALAAVNWAEAHIPVLKERFIRWQQRNPYELVMEPDPKNADWEFLVVYLKTALDELILGDAGAIINSTRTALDILMSAVVARHGIKPNRDTHFPIRAHSADFLAAVQMLKGKKWVSAREAAAIKRTKAYRGGDHFLFPLHQLDILRKHERLLTVEPTAGPSILGLLDGASYTHHRVMDDKTILYRIPARAGFRPTYGNTLLTAEIFFNEPTLLKTPQPADGVLRNFVTRVRALVMDFP